jgi:preprotein translocase subunit SecA
MRRINNPDRIFLSTREKFDAVVEEIIRAHRTGRPLLVGTISIENSEKLSGMLSRRGIEHDVLNAKEHQREAEIVKYAGEFGHVTVATNMAGRGTDIVLGRDVDGASKLEPKDFAKEYADVEPQALERFRSQATTSADGSGEYRGLVAELSGLYIIGTERHEARRIDNQLRGRAGRQGDPGESRFFVSLDDDLMRVFAGDWVRAFLSRLGMGEGQSIDSAMVSRQIEKAQKRVEELNFQRRKDLLEYDMVMDEQRRIIYSQRQDILEGKDLHGMVVEMVDDVVATMVPTFVADDVPPAERDYPGLMHWVRAKFAIEIPPSELADKPSTDLIDLVTARVHAVLDEREKEMGPDKMRMMERFLLLQIIDVKWKDHLHAMDQLRSGIGLRAYAQKDPKIEYKLEAYAMFEAMVDSLKDDVAGLLLRVRLAEHEQQQRESVWKVSDTQHAEVEAFKDRSMTEASESQQGGERPKPFVRTEQKVGRNDPCPCGSGKKYKKCCGAIKV